MTKPVLRPGTMIDHFRVSRLIGRGGMGEVYLARDTKLGRRAALKVVSVQHLGSKDAIDAFLHEARTTARFNHPNIITIHAVGEFQGRPYVALEYVEGINLRERMDERRPSLQESLRIALAIASALQEAHTSGVLHLDLKPENVVIPVDGRVRVVDFGLAKTFHVGDDEAPPSDEAVDGANLGWGTPAYVAPEQWRYGAVGAAADVWALGVILFELCSGALPFPQEPSVEKGRAICSSDPSPSVDAQVEVPARLAQLIAACLRKDAAARPSAADVVAELQQLVQVRAALADGEERTPFRGLLPFTVRDAPLFFGREAEVAAFVERLRHQPVVTVVGPSGAGKTSFVQAGIVPRLREQERWAVVRVRPGGRPFFTLADRICRPDAAESGPARAAKDVERLAQQLGDSPHQLALVLRTLAEEEGAKVLLIVEQLEELFTLVDDADLRARFMQAISTAADDALEPVRAVITVRDDFLGRLATGPEARQALAHVTVIESLGPAALTEILVKPVEAVGYRYEDHQMVREMTDAVAGEPGSLPLLQFAALELWEGRDRERKLLLRSTYEAMGGVEGALAGHADGILAGLSPAELRLARALFLRLVTPERTRSVVAKARALDGLGEQVEHVFERLREARLIAVVSPRRSEHGPALELAHESLIRKWGTLTRWLGESREEHAFLADVAQAAELWEKRGRLPDELWRGDALRDALRIVGRCATEVPPAALVFLAASERRQARRDRRRRLSLAIVIALGVVVTAGSVLIAIYVADKGREARRQRDDAQRQRAEALRAAARGALQQGNLLEARARLRGALEEQDSAGARALWWQLEADPRRWVKHLGALVYSVDFAPNGEFVAVGCQDKAIYVLDVDTRATRVLRGSDDQVYAVAISPDGALLASGTWSGRVALWDPSTGTRLSDGEGHDAAVRGLRFSPDGTRLASGSADGVVKVWRVPGQRLEHEVKHEVKLETGVTDLALGPQGRRVIAGTDTGLVLWDVESGGLTNGPTGTTVFGVDFSPDGRYIASGGNDKVVELWKSSLRSRVRAMAGHTAGIRSVRFSADGRFVASAGYDKTVRLWDVGTGAEREVYADHEAGVEGVALGPDGHSVVSVARDRTVRLRAIGVRPGREAQPGHDAGVYRVEFSPDGETLVSGSGDKTIALWDVETGKIGRTIRGHSGGVDVVTFSPDGRSVASGSVDLTVRIWDAASGAEQRVLTGPTGRVADVEFSPDGGVLVAASRDGTIRAYDVASGAQLTEFEAHLGGAYGVSFSPDGRRIVTGGADGKVVLWETETWRREREVGSHGVGVTGVAFGGEQRVASGGNDRTAVLWNLATGTSESLGPHGGRVYWVAFDRDGKLLGAPASDGTATIWRLEDRERNVLRGHEDEVNTVAFSPDGRLAATAADDGTVRVWATDSGAPRWRAPLLLPDPPRLFSHRGWEALDEGEAVAAPAGAWARTVDDSARLAAVAADGAALCLYTRDAQLELWDRVGEAPRVRRKMSDVVQLVAHGDGCLARDAAAVTLVSAAGSVNALDLAEAPSAMDARDDTILVAAGPKLIEFDAQGVERTSYSAGVGVVAVSKVVGGAVVAYAEGNIQVIHADQGKPPQSFDGVPASRAVRILPGPAETVVVGHANGTVGLWSLTDGTKLGSARLHGRVIHLLLERQRLYAATDLGAHLVWDLEPLYTDHCTLLRQLWRKVPVVWRRGTAIHRDPDPDHPCAEG